MQEWIQEINRNAQSIVVELKKKEALDIQIFERMANDDHCLNSVLKDQKKARILYNISNLVSLDDFLKQYTFEKEEGYCFLIQLFEQAIASNRNKPVLLDPNYIFINPHGDTFYFMVIPISLEEWMFKNDMTREWIEYLYLNFQTTTAFEIPGFLLRFMNAAEFSLPNLILGLQNIRKTYYPKKFSFFKKKTKDSFHLDEPIHSLYVPEIKEELIEEDKTQILGTIRQTGAYLMIDGQQYHLIAENMLIGRSMNCDIRLQDESVSLKHCRIVCENDRYYIQDLKSSNGTFLEEKRVQRKMRLKKGMHIHFANVEAIFYQ